MSQDERLVSVRRVADEATATMLCDFLRENGVPATAVAMQIPWLPGVETFQRGYWGEVEVLEHDAEKALALIEDFYAAEPEDHPDLDDEPEGNGHDDTYDGEEADA
ncbi:MAG TPA: hypothetical protein VLT84_05000 [Acidobacteriota bacterium]|nr:hypothetical protein [Acidobacteriota bacterium]